MAYATGLTISTGNKVSINYQTQEVSVTLTYQLERDDCDVLAVVREKTAELAQAHRAAWQTLRGAKVAAAKARQQVAEADGTPETRNGTAGNGAAPGAVSIPGRPAHLPADPIIEPLAPLEPATPGQRGALHVLLGQAKWSEEKVVAHLREQFDCERIEDLSGVQAAEWLLELQRAAREAAQEERLHASRNGAVTR